MATIFHLLACMLLLADGQFVYAQGDASTGTNAAVPLALSSATEVTLPNGLEQHTVCSLQLLGGKEGFAVFGIQNGTHRVLIYELTDLHAPLLNLKRQDDRQLFPMIECLELRNSSSHSGDDQVLDILAVDVSKSLIHVSAFASGYSKEDNLGESVYKYEDSAYDALPNILLATQYEAAAGRTHVVYVDTERDNLVFASFAKSFEILSTTPLPKEEGHPVRLLLRPRGLGSGAKKIVVMEALVVFESGAGLLFFLRIEDGITTSAKVHSSYEKAMEQGKVDTDSPHRTVILFCDNDNLCCLAVTYQSSRCLFVYNGDTTCICIVDLSFPDPMFQQFYL